MKILSLIDSLTVGGGQRIMCNIIKGMPDHEHIVAYFYHKPDQDLMTARFEAEGIPYIHIDERIRDYHPDFVHMPRKELEQSIQRVLRECQPDIVLRHFWRGREIDGRPFQIPRVKDERHVCVIHDAFPAPLGHDFYIPTGVYNDLKYQQHIPKSKKRLIYNGIDVEQFSVSREHHEGIIIGRITTLLESKIPPDWIDFADSFDIQNVQFIIAGDGPRKDQFAEKIRELRAPEKFLLPGNISYEEVPRWLRKFDLCCYLTSSHIETHSMALIEMAVAGVPVVAEARGSIPEQVIHGFTGLISQSREKIREYCEKLSRDSFLRQELSQNAREFGKRFSIEVQCRQYDEVFHYLKGKDKYFSLPADDGGEEKGIARTQLTQEAFIQMMLQVYTYLISPQNPPADTHSQDRSPTQDEHDVSEFAGIREALKLELIRYLENIKMPEEVALIADRILDSHYENMYLRDYLEVVQNSYQDHMSHRNQYILDLEEDIKNRIEDIQNSRQYIRDLEADLKNRLEDIGNKQSYIDEMEEIRKEQDEYIRNLEREREERERYVGELEKRFLNRILINLRERFRK